MFDLSLTQQVPPHTLATPASREAAIQLSAIIKHAFQLEQSPNLGPAIKAHETAKELVQSVSKTKGIRKFNRKMYERQAEIHQERIAYLEKVQRDGGSAVSVITENPQDSTSPSATTSEPLSTSAASKVEEYILTHTSDVVDVGVESFWFRLAKVTQVENTIYAIQGIWDMDRPMIETLLRRPNEFFPMGGHLHTAMLIQNDRTFKLRMRRRGEEEAKAIWEVPISGETGKKSWSPRTFRFNGRWFVWKEEEKGGLLKKWGFETLYETEGEGGKIVGEKLFWGKVGGGLGGKLSLFVSGALDVELREHVFASQVSRLMRLKYPPRKDISGIEKGTATVSAFGALVSLGQLLG